MFSQVNPQVNFPQLEKKILKYWQDSGIVKKYLHRNDKSNKRYSFLDGPITANNPMGVHHAWGRTFKDLWQRYFNMKGYRQRFQNGFDCQGLWVEVEVEKELGIKNKKEIENLEAGDRKKSIAKFVKMCRDRVTKYSKIQTEQSVRLGYFMDWDNSYFTMSDENNYMIWYFLSKCHENGWIYKGLDSVPWCPRCQTAISQHEMLTEDYKELTHETVFVKLPITSKDWVNTYLLIWTTTPWTVPANVAVGVNTKYQYGVWKDEKNDSYIFLYTGEEGRSPNRIDKKDGSLSLERWVMKGSGRTFAPPEKFIKGTDLIGLRYSAPFDELPIVQKALKQNPEKFHTVIDASNVVVDTEGTGLLHVAPGAGKEDFDLGKKEKLPVISVIDDDASYLKGMNEFSGKNAKKHPGLIIDHLKHKESGKFLLKTMHYTHRYPACWRCKTELVWKVTQEWYIAMDKKNSGIKNQELRIKNNENKTLREQMMDVAKKISWHPKFGLERELDWLSHMSDWLISKKNRYWGLALPIYECNKCGWFEVIESYEELKKKAVAGWSKFEGNTPHKPYIDEVKISCDMCSHEVSRIDDVGNVWLDAGIVPFSTFIDPVSRKLSYTSDKKYWQNWFPVDFITESFPGQFKNWFYSMIAMSTVLEKTNPFKTVLGFASMLGEDGRPMHKSWGNSIEFNEGADKIGVDVMRWMFCVQKQESDLLFGYKKADETRRKFHLILWNIYNFLVTYANLVEFKSQKSIIRSQNVLDRWILSKTNNLISDVENSLDKYDSSPAALEIENFVLDLSQWYVRRSRDRVSPVNQNISDRKQCLHVLFRVLETLSRILAPFNPYLAEEIYRNLTNEESVHLTDWPVIERKLIDDQLESEMSVARKISEAGHSIRKSQAVKVRIPLLMLDIQIDQDCSKIRNDIFQIVLDELNVKNIIINGKTAYPSKKVVITEEMLQKEGQARDLVRQIQLMRKELKCELESKIGIKSPSWPVDFEEYIKRETLAVTIVKGDKLAISKV